ncbi:MAG: hypothetical protein ACK46M_24970 [Planctomyces sp.]
MSVRDLATARPRSGRSSLTDIAAKATSGPLRDDGEVTDTASAYW